MIHFLILVHQRPDTLWSYLQKDIFDIFGSVHGLIYTIDVSPDVDLATEAKPWKCEFDVVVAALDQSKTPRVPLLVNLTLF